MTAILALIALSLILGGAALCVFLWALRHDQFDDLDGAAQRILFEDDGQSQIDCLRKQAPAGRRMR